MSDVIEGVGCAAVVLGVGLWSLPAALIVFGLMVIVAVEVRS